MGINSYPECQKCPLYSNATSVGLGGRGPIPSKYMIVGMNPSPGENTCLSGACGVLLDKALRELGIEARITNAVRCSAKTVTPSSIETCRQYLCEEIEQVKPETILLMGAMAVKSLLPAEAQYTIAKLRRNIFKYLNTHVIVTYHPNFLLRGGGEASPSYEKFFEDLKWGWSLANKEIGITSNETLDYRLIKSKEDLIGMLEHISKYKHVAVDFETNTKCSGTLYQEKARPLTIALSGKAGESFCVPLDHPESPFNNDPEVKNLLSLYLKDMKLVAHNSTFENAVFTRFFPHKIPIMDDTLLMTYIYNEGMPHDLNSLINTYTSIQGHKDSYRQYTSTENDEVPLDVLASANLADADGTIRVYDSFCKKMDGEDWIFYKDYVMKQFFPLICHMNIQGMRIDTEYVRHLIPKYIQKSQDFATNFTSLFGVNPNSSSQVSQVLLDLGFILPHTEKGGHSVNKEAIAHAKKFTTKDKTLLLEYIEKGKYDRYINSYYLLKMFDWLGEDSNIHPDWKIYGTISGRLSSSNLNLQNISKNNIVKKMFISRYEEGWLVSFDYKNHEFRMFALLMRDKGLIKDFKSGLDPHTKNASFIFKKSENMVTKAERSTSKILSFGVLYGSGAKTQAQMLGISVSEAQKLVKQFKTMYPSTDAYYKWIDRENQEKGYFQSTIGRKWHYGGLGFSQRVNLPIQGISNYLVLMAGYKLLQKGYNIISQVHDSLVADFNHKPTAEELWDFYTTCINIQLPGYEDIKGLWDGELSVGKSLGSIIDL